MYTLGIDLGGTSISAGLVDPTGAVIRRLEQPRPKTVQAMRREPLELARCLFNEEVQAIGLGAAGLVARGELVWGPNVVGERLPFRELLEDTFGVPAVVDNDANLAALAEIRSGAAQGCRHVLMLTLGTGIGGGIVIDGEVYRGAGFAGEIGHMVVDLGGPRCTCGRRGCLETFASGRRLDQLARDAAAVDPSGEVARLAGSGIPTGAHLAEAAAKGDVSARTRVEEVGNWLGLGIASLVAVLDPQMVVVGGAASGVGDVLLEPASKSMVASLEGAAYRSPPPVVAAAYGKDSGLLGAGLAAWEMING